MVSRVFVYPQQELLDTQILRTNKFNMVGMGFLMQAVLGSATLVDGLACTPTTPASLSVNVAPGSIYSLAVVDATAYGTEPADTVNQVVKQGITFGTTFTLTPPATSGKSQVYLIQAIFQEVDTASASIPFVNSSDSSQTFQTVNTERRGVCVLGLKAGVIANTGSQAAPAPDAGYTGLYAVTIANGQTTITSPNIVPVVGAPFLVNKLASLAPLNSPALTGSPTAPTPALTDNSTLLANTSYVNSRSGSSLAFSTGNVTVADGLIRYFGQNHIVSSAEADVTFKMPFAARISRLYGYVPTATMGSRSYTLRKNGSDTALAAASSGSSTTATNLSDTVDFAAGDEIDIKVVTSGGSDVASHKASVLIQRLS